MAGMCSRKWLIQISTQSIDCAGMPFSTQKPFEIEWIFFDIFMLWSKLCILLGLDVEKCESIKWIIAMAMATALVVDCGGAQPTQSKYKSESQRNERKWLNSELNMRESKWAYVGVS